MRRIALAFLALTSCSSPQLVESNLHVAATRACLARLLPPRREVMHFTGPDFPEFSPTSEPPPGQAVAYGYVREAYNRSPLPEVEIFALTGGLRVHSDTLGRYEIPYRANQVDTIWFLRPGWEPERLPLPASERQVRIDAELVFTARCPIS